MSTPADESDQTRVEQAVEETPNAEAPGVEPTPLTGAVEYQLLSAIDKLEAQEIDEAATAAHDEMKRAKAAYKQARLNDPKTLGFLRVIEVVFVFNICMTLVGLALTSRDVVVYSSANIVDWLNLVFQAFALWLIMGRMRLARPFVIGMALFNIVVGSVYDLAMGVFDPTAQLMTSLFDIVLLLYFLFSRRVRNILVNELRFDSVRLERSEVGVVRRGWPFVRNLIIYFCVFSVVGHWMEIAMCQLIRIGLVQGVYEENNTMLLRDWLFPFAMEGIAVVIIALALYPLKQWLVKHVPNKVLAYAISFLANMMLCVLIEFIGGLLFNANLQNWDYSDMPFNFMGQVCLQNALAFGAAASIIAWVVYPAMEHALSRVPKDVMNGIFVGVVAGYAILAMLYFINPPQKLAVYGAKDGAVEEEAFDEGDKREATAAFLEIGVAMLGGVEGFDEDAESLQGIIDRLREGPDGVASSVADVQAAAMTVTAGDAATEPAGASEATDVGERAAASEGGDVGELAAAA